MKKKLVVSAVSLTEGGTLTVLRECLKAAVDDLGGNWDIIALVHDKALINLPSVQCIEFPKAKRSWLRRLYYELHAFKKLSRQLDADLWLSLHDLTPNVEARRHAVYCHNPSPFYDVSFREVLLSPVFYVHYLAYPFVYKHNIGRNHSVVVQQKWLRDEFQQRYGAGRVVVAHPVESAVAERQERPCGVPVVFFFPALARFFKNFEVICQAAEILAQGGVSGFEVRMTIAGSDNRYAAGLIERFGNVPGLRFIGRQDGVQMRAHYEQADCLLFPSKLETWGLPITEAKAAHLPMLVADVRYAHETVGTYDRVRFFPPEDGAALADLMRQFIEGSIAFKDVVEADPAAPFARDWSSLLSILTDGL